LRIKSDRVKRIIGKYSELENVKVSECIGKKNVEGCRTRVKLPVGIAENGQVTIGLYKKGSHCVIDMKECPLIAVKIIRVLESIRNVLKDEKVHVEFVDVRVSKSNGKILIVFVTKDTNKENIVRLAEEIKRLHPEVCGIGLRKISGYKTQLIVRGDTEKIYGELSIEEKVSGKTFRVSDGAFFQADPSTAVELQRIVRDFLEEISPMRTLVDLYAGVGVFGICLSDMAKRILVVESVQSAANDAVESAKRSSVSIEVKALSAEEFSEMLADLEPDAIIIDPPRRGIDRKTIKALGHSGAKRIAYVSCNPETLTRDMSSLACYDYVCSEVAPVDMFAFSSEIETVAKLEKKIKAYVPQILWRQNEIMVVKKPWILSTKSKEMGKVSLENIVNRSGGCVQWRNVNFIDSGTSGMVMFAKEKAYFQMKDALANGNINAEFLMLVRGVPRGKGMITDRMESGRKESNKGVTRYKREAVVGGYGYVRACVDIGRDGQIEKHMRRIGHPVLGDEKLGDARVNKWLNAKALLQRPFIHMEIIRFVGLDGKMVEVKCELPTELKVVLEKIEEIRQRQCVAEKYESGLCDGE